MKLDINQEMGKIISEKNEANFLLSDWLINKKIVTEFGKEIEFDSHKFLEQPMNDWNPKQVVLKASQIGWSTLAIFKSFWASKMLNYNVIYTLPSERKLWAFGSSKTDEIIKRNEIFKSWAMQNATLQKKFGGNYIYFRGAFKEQDAISLTADLLVQDEYDRSKTNILDLYKSRLGISKYKGIWQFSNPSVPKQGVHRNWLLSDQKHWFIKCSHCSTQQFLGWFDSTEESEYAAKIDLENKTFKCVQCGKVIPEESRKDGKWVAKYFNKDWSGYWVSQLIAPWVSYKEIFDAFVDDETTTFYNFVLGLPTKGEKFQITKDLILSKCDPSTKNNKDDVVMGLDVGKVLHYVIGNKAGIFKAGKTDNWEDIELLIRQLKIRTLVIDSEPDITAPKKLQEKYKGKVYLANYHRGRKNKQWIEWGKDKNFGTVSMYRSMAIGDMVEKLRSRVKFTMFPEELYNAKDYEKNEDYVSQLESFYQVKELDKQTGEIYYKWDSGDDDHFGHATVYFLAGLSRGAGTVEISSEDLEEDKSKIDYFERAKQKGFGGDSWLES